MKNTPKPTTGVSPLTKYFKVLPKSEANNRSNMPTRRRAADCLINKRTRMSMASTVSPPSSPIEISSDDDIQCIDSPRKKPCHRLTIKQLFDDNISNKPEFPPVDQSWCPQYLRIPSSPSSSSEGSDNDLPLLYPTVKKPSEKPLQRDASPPSFALIPSINENFELPNTKPITNTNKAFDKAFDSVCDDYSCHDNDESEEDLQVTKEPVSDPMEDILEKLVGLETKKTTLDTVTNFGGLPKRTDQNHVVQTLTNAQEERVDHYLTMCMATPSFQLCSTINYLKMITSCSTIPSGEVLLKIWNFLLQNEINLPVAEVTVKYLSSLLCLRPPSPAGDQYNNFIIHIRSDLIDLLSNSNNEWRVALLEFVSGLLLQDCQYSSMQDSQSTPDKCPPLLFQQVFWPKSSLHHVNQSVRLFVRRSVELLEAEATSLMVRKLSSCCQILYLIHSCCDISQEVSIHYQRVLPSLCQSNRDLFLSVLRPLSLTLAIYKDLTTNQ